MRSDSYYGSGLKAAMAIVFLSISILTTLANAEEARLTDIVVTCNEDHLLVYFNVKNCFTEDLNKAIESGINTTFTFFISLYQIRDIQWDKKMADLKVRHDIVFDNLKEVYRIKLSERNNKMIPVKDYHEAKNLMSKIVGLKLIDLNRLQKGSRYRVRMMAELDSIRLPFYLDYALFFLSLWDFETDWYEINFTY
jgi:hypothetical protein